MSDCNEMCLTEKQILLLILCLTVITDAQWPEFVNRYCIENPIKYLDLNNLSNLPNKCFLNSCPYIGFYNHLSNFCELCEKPDSCRRNCFSSVTFGECYQQYRRQTSPLAISQLDQLAFGLQQRSLMERHWKMISKHRSICDTCDSYHRGKWEKLNPEELEALGLLALEKCRSHRKFVCWNSFLRYASVKSAQLSIHRLIE